MMKSFIGRSAFATTLMTVALPATVADAAQENGSGSESTAFLTPAISPGNRKGLRMRRAFEKPLKAEVCLGCSTDEIIIKFKDGTGVRQLSDDELMVVTQKLNTAEYASLMAENLNSMRIGSDLSSVNGLVRKRKGYLKRTFERPEHELDRDRENAETLSGEQLADLNLFYDFKLPGGTSPEDLANIVNYLNSLDAVEVAYVKPPPPQPAMVDIFPPTPNYEGSQGYLGPAPYGINARLAWSYGGGRGAGVRIIDVEQGWNFTHEDLKAPFFFGGVGSGNTNSIYHGTAVLGVMVAGYNSYGVTGIVSDADVGVSSPWQTPLNYNLAAAINNAAVNLRYGDIMLIEQQYSSAPPPGASCQQNCSQFGSIPVEYYPAEFAAISNATFSGIVVVEAGGNGSIGLNNSYYNKRFDLSYRDSGAILVGAGVSNTRSPHVWSNAGTRMDVQGWGDSVITLGYGDLFGYGSLFGGSDDRQFYTTSFGGTSSAVPIVAGAAAAIQGIMRARGQILSPPGMRTLLRVTGTPQGGGGRQVGPLPNLQAAVGALDCGHLFPWQGLTPGQSVTACNGAVRLVLQYDGNAVLYNRAGRALWHTKTNGKPSSFLFMAPGGWLTVSAGQTYLWSSNNAGSAGAYLAVQDDGNMVIYSRDDVALWATNTVGK